MSRSEAVKSGKGSPWDTDFEMMARKTILNWGFGSLPKTGISEHILKVIETETKMDNDDFEDGKSNRSRRPPDALTSSTTTVHSLLMKR